MKLTTRTRYGTRLLVELARHFKEGPVQLSEVARRQELPAKYLEQLVIPLKRAGLIKGMRGVKGGHMLARPPHEISVWDVVKAMEEDAITPCTRETPECSRFDRCETKDVWIKISRLISKELDKVKLSHLIDGEKGG